MVFDPAPHRTTSGHDPAAGCRPSPDDIDELAAARAENVMHLTEKYALRRIADVDELVTANNMRTGDDAGEPPRRP
ncbi:hypothetical protein ACFUJR_17915 [Streptomyces sp. NPDC057271]|uniref:hypothetical protein n=1 Tax=unclassified Streptomyces TaxID=2593676 RepID=UPI0036386D46